MEQPRSFDLFYNLRYKYITQRLLLYEGNKTTRDISRWQSWAARFPKGSSKEKSPQKKHRKNDHREKCPQGKMPAGKYAHKEKCPQGKMPTGKNAHREKCPQGKCPQGKMLTCI